MNESNTSPNQPTQPAPDHTHHRKTWDRIRGTLSTIGILLLAPAIALVLIAFVFQSYQVDGPSMENTLHNGDRLIVWKLPRTWARITGHQYVPKRGDIVIVTQSGLASYGDAQDSKQLIKRVIALPGERIVVKDSVITVYNRLHPKGFHPDTSLPYGEGGAIPPTSGNLDVTLSKTQLFICGDNRSDSLDSRIFGPIETHQVVGKLVARIAPVSDAERF